MCSTAEHEETNADPDLIVEEYELALRYRSVSFEQVVAARHARVRGSGQDRIAAAFYHPRLLQSFADAHRAADVCDGARGGVLRSHSAERSPAAAMLTADGELLVSLPPTRFEDAEFIKVLMRLQEVHLHARRVLDPRDLASVTETVSTVVAHCLSSLDASAKAADDGQPATAIDAKRARVLKLLQSECALAQEKIEVIAHRRAERPYFNVMLLTALVLVVAGAGLARLLAGIRGFDSSHKLLLATAVAGSVGATISVMSRMTFGRFSLGPTILALQQDRKVPATVLLLGAVRPVIGAVSGILFFVLERSGLLPFTPPGEWVADLYFYVAVAFVAGFSERWAQSTLKSVLPTQPATRPRPERKSGAAPAGPAR